MEMIFESQNGARSGQAIVLSVAAMLALGASVQAGTLAGKVFKPDSTALADVKVTLVGSETATTVSDANGVWSLTTTGTVGVRGVRTNALSGAKGAVQLQDGHLKLSLQGADVAGRNASKTSSAASFASIAGRSASVPDTLVYSVGDSVVLRDTITVLDQSGILRIMDTTINAAVTYGYLTDSRDGHWYRTVKIGKQLWMGQNLNYAVDSSWALDTALRYGRLYNWTSALALKDSCKTNSCLNAVSGPYQGVCPTGWHVPEDAELDSLVKYAGAAKAGKNLKAVIGWGSSANANTDSLGFAALPTGYRDYSYGTVSNQSSATYIMSATEYTSIKLSYRYFGYMNDAITGNSMNKRTGIPVRCVKN
jgi:uncharacterized protein (TIGR02145 family)